MRSGRLFKTKIVALAAGFVALSANRKSGFGTREDGDQDMNRRRLHILYTGRVQGVGFRYTVKNVATGFELSGTVRNLPDGRVELLAEGEAAELEAFRRAIQDSEVGGLIRHEDLGWSEAAGAFRGFEIVH
jgi:acylphosphatase